MTNPNELKGTEVQGIFIHYDNIMVHTPEGTCYLPEDTLLQLLKLHDFKLEKKRIRKWLRI